MNTMIFPLLLYEYYISVTYYISNLYANGSVLVLFFYQVWTSVKVSFFHLMTYLSRLPDGRMPFLLLTLPIHPGLGPADHPVSVISP